SRFRSRPDRLGHARQCRSVVGATAALLAQGRPVSPRALIAIDLGTQSLRVSAIDLEGRRLWSRQQPVATFGDGARQEQDAAAWRSEMLAGLAEAAQAGIV